MGNRLVLKTKRMFRQVLKVVAPEAKSVVSDCIWLVLEFEWHNYW